MLESAQRKASETLSFLSLLHVVHNDDNRGSPKSLVPPYHQLSSDCSNVGTSSFCVENVRTLPYAAKETEDLTLDFGNHKAIRGAVEELSTRWLPLDEIDRRAVDKITPGSSRVLQDYWKWMRWRTYKQILHANGV